MIGKICKIVEVFESLVFFPQTISQISFVVYGNNKKSNLTKVKNQLEIMSEITQSKPKLVFTRAVKNKLNDRIKQAVDEYDREPCEVNELGVRKEKPVETASNLLNTHLCYTLDAEINDFIQSLTDKIEFFVHEYDPRKEKAVMNKVLKADGKIILAFKPDFWSKIKKIAFDKRNMSESNKINVYRIDRDKLLELFIEKSRIDAEKKTILDNIDFKEFLVHWSIKKLKEPENTGFLVNKMKEFIGKNKDLNEATSRLIKKSEQNKCTAKIFMKVLGNVFEQYYLDVEMRRFLKDKYGIKLQRQYV